MNTKSDARWGHPVRVAAGVINDILHCSIKCHAPLSEAPTPTSGSLSIRDSLEEDFPCPNPLGGALLPSPPPCTNKRLVSPSENRFNLLYNFRTRSGVSSLRSSAAFRDSVVMREESTGGDDESSPQIETRRERCEDTLSASLLLKSINKYIKRTEKQREENAQLLQENSACKEALAVTNYRIAQHMQDIQVLDAWCQRLEGSNQQRQDEFAMLMAQQQCMMHDLVTLEENLLTRRQALQMLKAHTLRIFHNDLSSGLGETALQNLCVSVLRILSDISEF
eukprot:Blabericola_migrator_1__8699@NODE_4581_length_1074_cov_190_777557_g665_i1_p1_GENE_NODE_4581_length_1074_cov_190_777557_g665_i1NODE_4581_length_1074_cov_190_777557_g665_i1_p1_ORF_typecomplete_len280_score43_53Arm_APC_u3/PF16629_5/0_011DUF3301/PF11743_8/5_6e03DUF3301/PF11743_8/4_8e03DUF3301/PF11743_8/0_046Rootletin/PF15035_6/0_46ZapB/PF06005_12/2_8Atg14/PF10186_9/1_2HAUS5/PF14817_6/5_5_NODE_4581_length_1074_cov_190_777557_g665_i139878